jgi:hypothetical protein
MTKQNGTAAALCLAVALMAGAASAAGVFLRGDGTTAWATSVRGERYEYAATGVYAYNSVRIVAEGIGWDYATLFLAVPAMVAASAAVARGSLRGTLLALGLLAYFFYQYLEYATFWALGPLFPLFIAVFAASLGGIVLLASKLDLSVLGARVRSGRRGFPFRGMAILCLAMSAVLLLMWIPRIAAALSGQVQGILLGTATLVVQAYDLGLVVPLLLVTAAAALGKKPVAYILCPVVAVKAVAMGSAILAMLLSAWHVEGRLEAAPFAVFLAATVAALFLGIRMFASVRETDPAA